MTDQYLTGQPIRLSTTIEDIDGTITDPTALTLTYGPEGGSPATKHWPTPADITRTAAGQFYYIIPAGLGVGHYRYVWTPTGTAGGQDFDVFDVIDADTFPRLVSFADAKRFLGLVGTNGDALLDRMIGWASARILREIQATLTTVTERRPADGYVITVASVPIASITSITPVGPMSTAVTVADLNVRSALGGVISSYPVWMSGLYDVTFTAGTTTVPAGVDGATLQLIRHWWNMSQAHGSSTYGDTGFVPDFKGLPNTVLNMLASAPPPPPLMA